MQTLSRIESFKGIVIFLFLLLFLQKAKFEGIPIFEGVCNSRFSGRIHRIESRFVLQLTFVMHAPISPRHRTRGVWCSNHASSRAVSVVTPIDELDKKRRKRSGIISNWFVRLTVLRIFSGV